MEYFNQNGKDVAVVGSRTFTDKERLFSFLDKHRNEIRMIVSGGCTGPDSMAQEWAESRGFPCLVYFARWRKEDGSFDRGAGMRRNVYIIKAAQTVVAWHDTVSRGTANAIELAKKYNKKLILITFDATTQPKIDIKEEISLLDKQECPI